jgi:glucose/arabinose dehydrogenase/PKD repeat protein
VALALATLLGAVVSPLAPRQALAATLPTGFQDQVVFGGLTNPTAVAFSPDGRVFIAEKSGRIKVFDSLADGTPDDFVDLRTEVYNFWDRGLLGLALHPNFPSTPYVYALYTRDALPGGSAPRWGQPGVDGDPCPSPPGATVDGCVVSARLVRMTANGNVISGQPTTLLDGWCQQWPSHSIGDLHFGPDGMLYVSGGDGANFNAADWGQWGGTLSGTPTPVNPCGDPPGSPGTALTPPTAEGGALRSQDVRTTGDPTGLGGAILRIDPLTGVAPADNPLAGSGDANTRRILAYGLRNPFRFAFRPGTSELWVGDVGWSTYEEVTRIQSPLAQANNLGWPCYEGPSRQPSYDSANLNLCESLYAAGSGAVVAPYFAYSRSDPVVSGGCRTGGSSTAGVAFYPSSGEYPASYQRAMFLADYSRDCIWVVPAGGNGLPDMAQRANFVVDASDPIDLEIGPGGDLFYVDYGSDGSGALHRVRYFPANQPPTARIVATPSFGPAPLLVQFDGTSSTDPDIGDPLTYAWDLDGDGQLDDSSSAEPTRTYETPGSVTVRLRVIDSAGASDEETAIVTVGTTPSTPVIDTPTAGTTWKVGDAISFSGHAVDPQGDPIPASGLDWQLILHHCPDDCHVHTIQTWSATATGSFTAPDHEYPANLELKLTATDGDGVETTVSRPLYPRTVQLTLASTPANRDLTLNATTRAAPFTTVVIVGSQNQVSAPNQTVGTTLYTFTGWSDGGAQSHVITAGSSSATYTASFTVSSTNGDPAFTPEPLDQVATEGEAVSFDLTAIDPNGDSVSFSASGLPAGLSLNAGTGRISGTPPSNGAGTYPVEVTAVDGKGGVATAEFTISVHDAVISPTRRVRFLAGTYTGYLRQPDGSLVSPLIATLTKTSGASAAERRLLNGQPYLRIIDGIWAGRWVRESRGHGLLGFTAQTDFTSVGRATFTAGTYTGFTFSSTGTTLSSKTAAVGQGSGASADRRAVINGLPYLHLVNGIWAGYWVPEHLVAMAQGTYTGYRFGPSGEILGRRTLTVARDSGASATATRTIGTVTYLAISDGMFAGYWLPASSDVRLLVSFAP